MDDALDAPISDPGAACGDAAPPRAAGATPAWVGELLAGNRLALRDAYTQHSATVRAFGLRLLGDALAAEDLVQEVFLGLPSAIGAFRGDAPVESFLLGIAANKARRVWRGAMRRRAAYSRLSGQLAVTETPVEERLGRRQLADKLLQGLERLSLEQRVVFTLCAVEERSAAEAARILGCPATTIRDRLRAARERLRAWVVAEGLQ